MQEFPSLEAMTEAIRQQDGREREGVVARFCFPDGGCHRVKIKAEDYLNKHKQRDQGGFQPKKLFDAIRRNNGEVEKLRNIVPEEFLAEFDSLRGRVEAACDAALRDVADQRERAGKQRLKKRKHVDTWIKKNAAWRDGTPISACFKALSFAPFVPWEDCAAEVPTAPGAWRGLDAAGRRALLQYVLSEPLPERADAAVAA